MTIETFMEIWQTGSITVGIFFFLNTTMAVLSGYKLSQKDRFLITFAVVVFPVGLLAMLLAVFGPKPKPQG